MDALPLEMQIVVNLQIAQDLYRQGLNERSGLKRARLEIIRNKLIRDNFKARRWLNWAKQ